MFADITIKESEKQIQDKITKAIRDHLNSKFPGMIKSIEPIIKKKIFDAITHSATWSSMQGGSLQVELGLVDGADRLLNILNIWLSNINITFKKFRVVNEQLEGGILIEAIESDYTDVLNTNEAILITEKGEALPWLQWLLFRGSSIIIGDYSVQLGSFGRTGRGHMIASGSWGIPPEFAGSEKNNFITKALADIQPDIEKEITTLIERNI